MKFLLAVLCLCVVLSCVLMPALACSPGSSWNDGCNSCRCDNFGNSICTTRYCGPPISKSGGIFSV